MASFKLVNLNDIDKEIQDEHIEWLEAHRIMPKKPKEPLARFGLVGYPELWSGNRLGETRIQKQENLEEHFSVVLLRSISWKKKKFQDNYWDAEVARYQKLEDEYKLFLEHLKERFLLRAIEETLLKIPSNEETKELKNFYQAVERSPLNFQTEDQCLTEHAKITTIIKTHRIKSGLKDHLNNLEQLEILSKRRLDIHYENVTKKTKTDKILGGITATTSAIGLGTGIAAAALGIGGFFFPPLWVPAAILGYISLTSYVGTAITISKVAKSGANSRSPSMKQTKELVIDALLLPLNAVGGIFRGIISPISKISKKALNATVKISNNEVSNLMDIPFVKDISDQEASTISTIRAKKLANSTSVTTMSKIHSLLTKYSVAKADTAMKNLTKELQKKPLVLAKITDDPEKVTLLTSNSQHDIIVTWDFGCMNSRKYHNELQYIQEALKKYEKLPADATYKERSLCLYDIRNECVFFIEENENNNPPLIEKMTELKELVSEELQNLKAIVEGEQFPIANWNFGFLNLKKYGAELQGIQEALKEYQKLPTNIDYKERNAHLYNIEIACRNFIEQKISHPLISQVKELRELVFKEIDSFVINTQPRSKEEEEKVLETRPILIHR